MTKKQKHKLIRVLTALTLFVIAEVAVKLMPTTDPRIEFTAFLVSYLIAGLSVLTKAARGIMHGQVLNENFLMAVASLGSFALVFFPDTKPHMAEGAAIMIFYQLGEWFESYAVGRSRKSIATMMNIAPHFANIIRDGELVQIDPNKIAVGEVIIVKPGELIPLDGVIEEGESQLDTAALTGEAIPRAVKAESEVTSGCINLTGVLAVRTTKPYADSTVSHILELIENASEKKAHTENFITRFARYYTPIVVGAAILLAAVPPLLFGQSWADWIERGLIFLVVSCPCALVISIPLSFFSGIGGASRQGILIKGGNYLEALSKVETVAFDKTGTLTDGSFSVVAIHASSNANPNLVISVAAHAEFYSNHPIAVSVKAAYSGEISKESIHDVQEKSGYGVRAVVDEHVVVVGNNKLMDEENIPWHECSLAGTILHVALDGAYIGHIIIADVMKNDAAEAVAALYAAGVKRTIMLTGDQEEAAQAVAKELGINEYRAQLLPQEKVVEIEQLLDERHLATLVFVGDGINDAPVLMRADVGIAMGGMGSNAAIEAADIVLMDDQPSKIAKAIRIARKTMRIVWQNIVLALGVKFLVLGLATFGLATMWLAVFADVGVACLAILNALRALRV